MKKMFTVLFAGMLLLAFAGVASADHRVWTGDQPNYTFAVGGQIEIDGWLQDNYAGSALNDDQLRFYNEETRIFFKGNWGDVLGFVRLEWDYDWDYDNQNKGNTTQNALDLAYLQFPVPGTPVTILAGLKDIKFGKIAMWLDDSYYVLQANTVFGDSNVALGTLKLNENKVPDGDDKDAYYVLLGTKAIPSVNLSAIWLTLMDDTISDDYAPWTLGITADGAAGGMKWWVEGYYQGGSLDEDVDVSAYAVAGGLGMAAAGADFGLVGLYASGEGDEDSDYEQFEPIPSVNTGDQVDLIVVDDLAGNDVGNLWAVAVNGTMKPVANLSVMGQVGFYNTVEDIDDENYVGTEVDLVIKYKINDYLGWKVAAGYLFAGDVLDAMGDDDNLFELNNEFMVTF